MGAHSPAVDAISCDRNINIRMMNKKLCIKYLRLTYSRSGFSVASLLSFSQSKFSIPCIGDERFFVGQLTQSTPWQILQSVLYPQDNKCNIDCGAGSMVVCIGDKMSLHFLQPHSSGFCTWSTRFLPFILQFEDKFYRSKIG
jgi:hypothetical protein